MALPNKKDNTKSSVKPAATEPAITPHTVVEELPLEKIIENKLAENNVTKRVLNAMKNKYLAPIKDGEEKQTLKAEFILKDPTDKETYLFIKEERKGVRKVGIITEKICEKGRADAVQIQRLWIGREKEVLSEVATVQDKLDEQIKIYEDEQERLRLEEEKRKDEQLVTRQAELIKMGAVNANGCMNINDLSIENSSIREADDDVYNETILPLFKMHYEKNEADRIEKDNEKKRQDDLLKEQQDKLKEEQDKLKQQQDQLQQQQQQFLQQQQQLKEQKIKNRCLQLEAIGLVFSFKEDAYIFENVNVDNKTEVCLLEDSAWEELLQKIKPEIEQRKKDAIAREERKTKRAAQLSALGMTFTGSHYIFSDISIPATDLTGMEDQTWNELIATTTPMITDRKEKAAKLELGRSRMAKLKGIGLVKEETVESLGEMADDAFEALADEYRKEVDTAIKKQQQDKATDQQNWEAFIQNLNEFVVANMPEFKDSAYTEKRQLIKEKLEEISAL